MDLVAVLRMLGALGVVLGLLAGALWFVRRYNIRLPGAVARGGAGGRVALVERVGLDARRSVALVRRDGREHLILLSPEGNMLIESAILRDEIDEAAAEARAAEERERAAEAERAAAEARENMRAAAEALRERGQALASKGQQALRRARGSIKPQESFEALVSGVMERSGKVAGKIGEGFAALRDPNPVPPPPLPPKPPRKPRAQPKPPQPGKRAASPRTRKAKADA